jgi:hypothetical protein
VTGWAAGVNPRRVVVEDRAEAVAEQLAGLGDRDGAARVRALLPARAGGDAHLPALRAVLAEVAASGLPEGLRGLAARVVAAVDDLPAAVGVRGTVWAGWRGVGYAPVWLDDAGPLQEGPREADLATTLAWARARAEVVLLRPEWSQGTYYSVGPRVDPRHPRLVLP